MRAEASTTGASIAGVFLGATNVASWKPPSTNWSALGADKADELDVPALELGKPAARADFGLQQADVALGHGDLVSTSSSAARSEATRRQTR